MNKPKKTVGTCGKCGLVLLEVRLNKELTEKEIEDNIIAEAKQENYFLEDHNYNGVFCDESGKMPKNVYEVTV